MTIHIFFLYQPRHHILQPIKLRIHHDSSNHGVEQAETEEPYKIEPLKENQQTEKTTITEEIGGGTTSERKNDNFEEIKGMALKEIKTVKTVKPIDKFVRDAYI